jgi:hypothetical protein
MDYEYVRELVRVNGDLGRLGGLLKLWLTDDPRTARFGDATILALLGRSKPPGRNEPHEVRGAAEGRALSVLAAKAGGRPMIVKHVPMRSLGKSDFAGLVNYVTDAQSKDHRLGQVQITNCDAVSVQDAITEVLATQHTNTRAKGDKTYHLIVSFRAGEQPSVDTLRAIEERICAGLGFASISVSVPFTTTPTTCTSTSPSTRFTPRGTRCTSRSASTGRWPNFAWPWSATTAWSATTTNHASAGPRAGRPTWSGTRAWKAWSAGSSANAWTRSRVRNPGRSCTRSCATTAWSCASVRTAW